MKIKLKFVCASRNGGKIKEFRRLFENLDIELLSLDEINFPGEIDETGRNFQENAFIKAKAAADFSGLPAFADDSGLEVDALGGAPGAYSARFGGHGLDDAGRRAFLLSQMEDIPEGARTARFTCALCLYFPGGKTLEVSQSCEGEILREERGSGGFGYDALFLCGDKTFSELDAAEKDKISHRGKAVREFAEKFKLFSSF
ncbi:MAG: RdgB/HAM1 family non-canonical purine NTP pyrophosphatase [Oscillospiraceae bacterium]|jgi:XTP/dITP diphosphohydrolase|nr:RdgB/HAM1 family non-canonical purine NTP pyrophosphatase [Oscillospiraceae bacterium]